MKKESATPKDVLTCVKLFKTVESSLEQLSEICEIPASAWTACVTALRESGADLQLKSRKPEFPKRTVTRDGFSGFFFGLKPMQMTLFAPQRRKRVFLSELDRAYRQKCVDEDLEFPDYLLLEARCQRAGCSKGHFASMFRADQNRELADEACILRGDDWEYSECTWIDWEKATAAGRAIAGQFQKALCDIVEQRTRPALSTFSASRSKNSARRPSTDRES